MLLVISISKEWSVILQRAGPSMAWCVVCVQVRLWTVEDVCRWLDTLRLGQYKQAFKEASVDGEFLLELREEDMMQVRHHSPTPSHDQSELGQRDLVSCTRSPVDPC